jgi:hypothetical protein
VICDAVETLRATGVKETITRACPAEIKPQVRALADGRGRPREPETFGIGQVIGHDGASEPARPGRAARRGRVLGGDEVGLADRPPLWINAQQLPSEIDVLAKAKTS